MSIPVVEAPDLPKGAKEMARLKEDWDEISDSFGMVTVRVSVGKRDASKLVSIRLDSETGPSPGGSDRRDIDG